MAFNYSPKIVTDGLVLYLDAANPRSYTSGSTSWLDLSRSQNNGILVNGPTFNSIAGGSIRYDGINDYTSGTISNLNTNAITLEAWVYHLAISNNVQRYVSTFLSPGEQAVIRYDGAVGIGAIRFYIVTTTGYKLMSVPSSVVINNWYHIVGTWNGTTQIFYKNAAVIASSNQTGTLVNDPVACYTSLESEAMDGYIPIVKVYNRALSATEVLQNYNALKGRYGL